ncbi:MAG TPA: LuxR C-terminal-related transcriptional regulator [Mucilaginibacter sp.]|jgi:DNA-binding CsgD family transcriptional regulator
MNNELFHKQAIDIWKKGASEISPRQLHFELELELYKKLLSFFQVGEYYYYIFNIRDHSLDLISSEVETVLGYHPSEMSLQFLMDKVHPDDRVWFLSFENKVMDFLTALPIEKLMKYKRRYDYRLKKKNGEYIRVLHQTMVIEHDENGRLLRTLGVHTDITHLKPEGKPVLSFIGFDGEPSYINVDVKKVFSISKDFLSKREKQILLLIMEGKLSKEISEILHISKQTVDTHRNNMIERNKVRNTSELITQAIIHGWI